MSNIELLKKVVLDHLVRDLLARSEIRHHINHHVAARSIKVLVDASAIILIRYKILK